MKCHVSSSQHSRSRPLLEATGYSSIDSNIQTVLREIGKRPALITAYLSTVINAAADNLPDPRHMDCLF